MHWVVCVFDKIPEYTKFKMLKTDAKMLFFSEISIYFFSSTVQVSANGLIIIFPTTVFAE